MSRFTISNPSSATLRGLTTRVDGTRITDHICVSPNSLVEEKIELDSEVARTIAGVVRIRSGVSLSGSGVSLRDDGLVLTAAHVIGPEQELAVEFPLYKESLFLEYETKKAKLLSCDKRNDLALLKIRGLNPNSQSNLKVSSSNPEQHIYSLGYTAVTKKLSSGIILGTDALVLSLGEVISNSYDVERLHSFPRLTGNFLRELSCSQETQAIEVKNLIFAYLSSVASKSGIKKVSRLATSAFTFPGNSGGPVLNENQELVGIHHTQQYPVTHEKDNALAKQRAENMCRGMIRLLGLREPELDFSGISFNANSTQILDFLSRAKVPIKDIVV